MGNKNNPPPSQENLQNHFLGIPDSPKSIKDLLVRPLRFGPAGPEISFTGGGGVLILFEVSTRFTLTQEFHLFRNSGISARRPRNLD